MPGPAKLQTPQAVYGQTRPHWAAEYDSGYDISITQYLVSLKGLISPLMSTYELTFARLSAKRRRTADNLGDNVENRNRRLPTADNP